MSDFFIILQTILWYAFLTALLAFIVVSIVLFIRDGILAKREPRCRKRRINIMFTVAMTLAALAVILVIFAIIIGMAIMRSM